MFSLSPFIYECCHCLLSCMSVSLSPFIYEYCHCPPSSVSIDSDCLTLVADVIVRWSNICRPPVTVYCKSYHNPFRVLRALEPLRIYCHHPPPTPHTHSLLNPRSSIPPLSMKRQGHRTALASFSGLPQLRPQTLTCTPRTGQSRGESKGEEGLWK